MFSANNAGYFAVATFCTACGSVKYVRMVLARHTAHYAVQSYASLVWFGLRLFRLYSSRKIKMLLNLSVQDNNPRSTAR